MSIFNKVQMTKDGPFFSKFVQGYWRMANWDMSSQEHLSFIEKHLEYGITTVDHAHVYGNPSCEELFGKALKLKPALRDSIEIVTKCGIQSNDEVNNRIRHYFSGGESIIASADYSLKRLGIEAIDLFLLHRPDSLMDADDVATAFHKLKQDGKVKYFGVSNFSPSQFSLLQSRLEFPLVTNQIEINPVNLSATEDGTLDFLQENRIIPMAWSCLAGGQIFNQQTAQVERLRKELIRIKGELMADSIDQVIFAWVMRLPAKPLPIIGSGNIDRVKSAVKSLELTMSGEQWYRIWAASKGHGVA